MKIAVTGHRPSKLWGYNYSHPQYQKLGRVLRDLLVQEHCDHAISGMALGVDTVFALVVLKLEIPLECAIPCIGHSIMWQRQSVELYDKILTRATKVTMVTNSPYTMSCMQKRNEYMVNECDVLIAVWDGTSGGTGNCVRYAQSVGTRIVRIDPRIL